LYYDFVDVGIDVLVLVFDVVWVRFVMLLDDMVELLWLVVVVGCDIDLWVFVVVL